MRLSMLCGAAACGLVVSVAAADESLPAGTLAALKDATAYIQVERGTEHVTGSGFLVRVRGETGFVVTNFHVIDLTTETPLAGPAPPIRNGAARPGPRTVVTVVFASGSRDERSLPGEIVAADRAADLAVVKVGPVPGLPRPIDCEPAAELRETLSVFALGFPLGQQLATGKRGPAVSVTRGSITSIRRDDNDRVAVVQIDSDVNPGNSGGPVVDVQGRLVGIAAAKVRDTRIGLAVPAGELAAVLDGRLGAARVERLNAREARVEVEVVDPLEALRTITLQYAPVANSVAGATPLLTMKGSRETALKRQGLVAIGTFPLESPENGEVVVVWRVTGVTADGKTRASERRQFVVRAASQPAVANRADPAGKALPEDELTRLVGDLLQPGRSSRAADALVRVRPVASRQGEVTKALRSVVSDPAFSPFARRNAIRALGRWGTAADVDFLVPVASGNSVLLRTEAIEALGWLGGAKAARAVAGRIDNAHDRPHVLKSLERIGPAAEEVVVGEWLGGDAVAVRLDGCNLLKALGTERSVPALEARAREDASEAVRLAAAGALQAIRQRRQAAAGK